MSEYATEGPTVVDARDEAADLYNAACEAQEYRPPLWRRIVDRVTREPIDESWYELHDQVPKGGDMLTTRTVTALGWRMLLRLLIFRRCEMETRVITAAPVTTVSSHGRFRCP